MKRYKGIYFDQAATSYPKPRAVLRAARQAVEAEGGNPGRSAHPLALAAAARVYSARETLADFFDLPSPTGVVFTKNATEALNLSVAVYTAKGGHVLCDDMAHNALLRPLYAKEDRGEICLSFFAGDDPKDMERAIRPDTVLVCATHASNICGRVCDAAAIGRICRARGIPFLLDASQSAGHLPVSAEKTSADVICLPAHKGLYGIMGAGVALFTEPKEDLPPFLLGGAGAFSSARGMPSALPEHFEAGTLPLPAIAAAEAGVKEIVKIGLPEIEGHITALEERLFEGLGNLSGITLYGEGYRGGGILSFTHEKIPPEALAFRLSGAGIALRAGLHCAPLAHATLKTPKDGTVRLSVGRENSRAECEKFLLALSRAVKE